MSSPTFPYLKQLTNADLVKLLGEYIKNPSLAEADKDFIEAIKHELKYRKPETWKEDSA
jgi:hypothetical protein